MVNVVDTGGAFHDVGQAISHLVIVVLPKFIGLLHSLAPALRILFELGIAFGLVIRANGGLDFNQSTDNLFVFALDFLKSLRVIVDLGSGVHFICFNF